MKNMLAFLNILKLKNNDQNIFVATAPLIVSNWKGACK